VALEGFRAHDRSIGEGVVIVSPRAGRSDAISGSVRSCERVFRRGATSVPGLLCPRREGPLAGSADRWPYGCRAVRRCGAKFEFLNN
jgi:hypothetical protein